MSRTAKAYIFLVIGAGCIALLTSSFQWTSIEPWRCLLYLAVSILAGPVKLRLPGMEGTYSPAALLGLVGVVYCAFPEALLGALAAALSGSLLFTKKRPTPIQVLFNLGNVAVTIGVCRAVLLLLQQRGIDAAVPAGLTCLAATHFFINTIVVSGILSLVTGKPLRDVMSSWYLESFPYFLGGSALLVLLPAPERPVNPEAWLFTLTVLYLVHFLATVRNGRDPVAQTDRQDSPLSSQSWVFIALVCLVGGALLCRSIVQFQTQDALRFVACLAASLVTAQLKVRVPGLTSTVSLHYVVKLIAIAALSLPEAILIGASGAMAQSVFGKNNRLRVDQLGFNAGVGAVSTLAAFAAARSINSSLILSLIVAALVLYVSSTLLVSMVVCLTENRPLPWALRQLWSWSFAYYIAGAGVAGLAVQTIGHSGWLAAIAVLPLLLVMFVSYRLHLQM